MKQKRGKYQFFSADFHLGHDNIIQYCNRPFKDRKHMLDIIVANTNSRATYGDTVYHLGDYLNYGNAKGVVGDRYKPDYYHQFFHAQFVHILGNHDRNNGLKHGLNSAEIQIGKYKFFLTHKPEYTKYVNPDVNAVLCGHVHDKWKEIYRDGMIYINVGIDARNYYPVRADEVIGIYEKFKRSLKKNGISV